MRRLLTSAILILLGTGCSTDPNTGNTTVVPAAPSSLTATVISTTQVNLHWTDNSTNEVGYKIQRKTTGGNFSDIGSRGADVVTYSDINLTPNTTYTYRVYSYNSAGKSLQYSNEVTVTTALLPTLTTSPISDTTATSANSGGNITSDSGSPVTARGICWSTSSGPTVALNTKTNDGSGTGNFTSNITGLSANTTYYVRAYATNANGTAYGNEVSFTTASSNVYTYTAGSNVADINGNVYPSIVTSCGQTWTSKNLTVSRYRNGDVIPQVTDPTQWANLTTGAWCWYNNDSAAYAATYGRLYNWYAVNDPRGLAPEGWHVPTDAEWNKLTKCIDSNAGTAMKSTSGWFNNGNGTNSSGFAGHPGGLRYNDGMFKGVEDYGGWWSASEFGTSDAWNRHLNCTSSTVYRGNLYKKNGFSVRVVRN